MRIVEQLLTPNTNDESHVRLYIALFPKDVFPIAKQFWQHTGEIISSRFAEYACGAWETNDDSIRSGAEKG